MLIQPRIGASFFQRTGEDLHAAAVADEDHDFIAVPAHRFQQSRQRIIVDAAGQIVAHRAEGLLTGKVVFTQQAEELVHIGHRAPLLFQRRGVGGVGVLYAVGRANRQRAGRRLAEFGYQRLPCRHIGFSRWHRPLAARRRAGRRTECSGGRYR